MSYKIGIFDIVAHTPDWVWAVLALLVWRGLTATRERDVGAARLVILPLVIVLLALHQILGGGLGVTGLVATAAGIAGGIVAGRRRFAIGRPVRIAPGVLHLHGEWATLGIVLTIFAVHYASGVVSATDPGLAANAGFRLAIDFLSAFLSTTTATVAALRLHLAYAGGAAARQQG